MSTVVGKFDMGSMDSHYVLADQNIRNWENALTTTVRSTELSLGLPQTMTSVGSFTQNASNYAKTLRIARPQPSLSSSSLVSFVDFHISSMSHTMESQVDSIGVQANTVTKPMIFGEFGEHTRQAPNAVVAGIALGASGKDRVAMSKVFTSADGSSGRGTTRPQSSQGATT